MSYKKIAQCTKPVYKWREHFVLTKNVIKQIQRLAAEGHGIKFISRRLDAAHQSVRKYRNPDALP